MMSPSTRLSTNFPPVYLPATLTHQYPVYPYIPSSKNPSDPLPQSFNYTKQFNQITTTNTTKTNIISTQDLFYIEIHETKMLPALRRTLASKAPLNPFAPAAQPAATRTYVGNSGYGDPEETGYGVSTDMPSRETTQLEHPGAPPVAEGRGSGVHESRDTRDAPNTGGMPTGNKMSASDRSTPGSGSSGSSGFGGPAGSGSTGIPKGMGKEKEGMSKEKTKDDGGMGEGKPQKGHPTMNTGREKAGDGEQSVEQHNKDFEKGFGHGASGKDQKVEKGYWNGE
jgi:hypothetical protein